MKMYGTKRILPVYGNSRPVERRINNVKIAGWKEQLFNTTSVSQNDTYNDSAFLKIKGKSEQVQTVQGKNLFDKTKTTDGYRARNTDGTLYAMVSMCVTDFISVIPGNRYIFSGFIYINGAQHGAFYDADKQFVSGFYSATISGVVPINAKYLRYSIPLEYKDTFQLELGSTATDYEPFIPDSPSPDYPSPINSVENFDLVSSNYPSILPNGSQIESDFNNLTAEELNVKYPFMPIGKVSESTIHFSQTLRSLPDGTRDYIEIDNVNKTAKLYRNVEEYTFIGNESWILQGGTNPNANNIISFFMTVNVSNTFPSTTNLQSISNYLVKDAVGLSVANKEGYFVQGGIKGTTVYMRFNSSRFPDVTTFKTWLAQRNTAGTPVTVHYELATPTIEDLSYNEVKTYYPYTNIYTTATTQPTLDGKIRIIDKGE